MRTDQSRRGRAGMAVAAAVLAAGGVIGGVSAASAKQDVSVYAVENGNEPCFSASAAGPCTKGKEPEVRVSTGDKVVFKLTSGAHNASSKGSTPANEAWDTRKSPIVVPSTDQEWTFGRAGVYRFICDVHPTTMTGTIVVEGDPVETPTATATATATATSTPTVTATATPTFAAPKATATPDNHLDTPAPGKAARTDTRPPQLTAVKATAVKAGAKVTVSASEPVTLRIVARRGPRTVTSATMHVPAGKRLLTLRSSNLRKRGVYSLELRAVDAMANVAGPVKTTLKVK